MIEYQDLFLGYQVINHYIVGCKTYVFVMKNGKKQDIMIEHKM